MPQSVVSTVVALPNTPVLNDLLPLEMNPEDEEEIELVGVENKKKSCSVNCLANIEERERLLQEQREKRLRMQEEVEILNTSDEEEEEEESYEEESSSEEEEVSEEEEEELEQELEIEWDDEMWDDEISC
jgi:hypothetical protein